MAAILVAHGYHLPLDPRENAAQKPYPPLGTLVSAAAARDLGHDVALYDPMFCRDVATFDEALRGHKPRQVAILADPHAIAQKMCTVTMREAAMTMVRAAKAHGAAVMVAGPDASDRPEAYRAAGANVVVVGEHDAAFLAWIGGALPEGVLARQPLPAALSVPFPAWDLVDMAAYAARWRRKHGAWEMNVSTARGCPYRCNWCAKPTWGRSYRVRSVTSVVAEIAALRARWKPDQLWFTDDIFAIRPAWLREFRSEMESDPIPYRCLTRVDLLRDEAYVKDLAASGCREVWLGAESGSQSVLDAMDKECTIAEIERASSLLRAHGIRRGFFLQLGYPGERYADVLATAAMVRRLAPDEIGISVSYPLPGTVFHERVRSQLAATNWSDAMENAVLYDAPFPQRFYDVARELLRSEHAVMNFRWESSRQGVRRAAGAAYHLARWPLLRGRLSLASQSAS